MKTVNSRPISSARGAAAGFGAHVRKQRGYFGNAYDLARARAKARDAEIAARLADRAKAS